MSLSSVGCRNNIEQDFRGAPLLAGLQEKKRQIQRKKKNVENRAEANPDGKGKEITRSEQRPIFCRPIRLSIGEKKKPGGGVVAVVERKGKAEVCRPAIVEKKGAKEKEIWRVERKGGEED